MKKRDIIGQFLKAKRRNIYSNDIEYYLITDDQSEREYHCLRFDDNIEFCCYSKIALYNQLNEEDSIWNVIIL